MARLIGVPVVMGNKCGRWQRPMPGIPFWKQDSRFPGLSTIVDSDGTVIAQLGDEEAIIVGDVRLDPSPKNPRATAMLRPVGLGRPLVEEFIAVNRSLWKATVFSQLRAKEKGAENFICC